jgi:membrane protein implicated in regulation of membrane protease activity
MSDLLVVDDFGDVSGADWDGSGGDSSTWLIIGLGLLGLLALMGSFLLLLLLLLLLRTGSLIIGSADATSALFCHCINVSQIAISKWQS